MIVQTIMVLGPSALSIKLTTIVMFGIGFWELGRRFYAMVRYSSLCLRKRRR